MVRRRHRCDRRRCGHDGQRKSVANMPQRQRQQCRQPILQHDIRRPERPRIQLPTGPRGPADGVRLSRSEAYLACSTGDFGDSKFQCPLLWQISKSPHLVTVVVHNLVDLLLGQDFRPLTCATLAEKPLSLVGFFSEARFFFLTFQFFK